MKLLGLGLFSIIISLSQEQSQATTSIAINCPEKFTGNVTKIFSSNAPFSSIPKIDILFDVEGVEKTITTLKGGPHRFKSGDRYEVSLKDNLICNIKKI